MFNPQPAMSMSPPRHLFAIDQCTSCRGVVELECEGVSGYAGYPTFNEYLCPYCKKLNHAQTLGAIVSARETHTVAAKP